MAWRDRDHQFLAGTRAAALVLLVVPALAIVMPLTAYVSGLGPALLQALLGFAGAVVLLEALLFDYRKVPFTCSYVPSENVKALAPLYFLMFMIGAVTFAGLERTALQDAGAALRLLALLGVLFAVMRIVSRRRPRLAAMDFNEVPVTTQRLGLNA
jgi:hypothetical protein